MWPLAVDTVASRVQTIPGRLLLKGTCSLTFEGQSFVPEGSRREYWLDFSDATRDSIVDLLRPLGWQDGQSFEAEFFGMLIWKTKGCGHLGLYGGIVTLEQLVSVNFKQPARPARHPDQPTGIRNLMRWWKANQHRAKPGE